MHSFKIAASMAFLFSALVAAVPAELSKRATGPSCSDEDFKKAILDTHNAHRVYHQVGDLEWDDTLADYANQHVNNCKFAHTGGPYGENLFAIWPGYDNWTDGTIAGLKSWVYEVEHYSYADPGFSEQTGHFTQFVWKDSTKVGCSWNTVNCDGMAILMCEYDPPGNFNDDYSQNVLPPAKEAHKYIKEKA